MPKTGVLGAALLGEEPAPKVVEVEACLLSRPATFCHREPKEDFVARLVIEREHMSPASLISNTLQLAHSCPLLLLHVRDAEERKASLVRKHRSSLADYSTWKRTRHGKTRDDKSPPTAAAGVRWSLSRLTRKSRLVTRA